MGTWRDIAAPKIASIIRSAGTKDVKELRKLLRAGYPFFERKYWPYKIWCDEVRIQLGIKKRKSRLLNKEKKPLPGQSELF